MYSVELYQPRSTTTSQEHQQQHDKTNQNRSALAALFEQESRKDGLFEGLTDDFSMFEPIFDDSISKEQRHEVPYTH